MHFKCFIVLFISILILTKFTKGENDDLNKQIADPSTLWDLFDSKTQNLLTKNIEETLSWQPYGNVQVPTTIKITH